MAILDYLKGMIALAILAFIGYINIWAFNFTGEATAERHGELASLYAFTLQVTLLLFTILVVGLFLSYRSLKKENKRLKSKLESQGD
jgi:glycerol-3-phosphate acyltransferase PlsY